MGSQNVMGSGYGSNITAYIPCVLSKTVLSSSIDNSRYIHYPAVIKETLTFYSRCADISFFWSTWHIIKTSFPHNQALQCNDVNVQRTVNSNLQASNWRSLIHHDNDVSLLKISKSRRCNTFVSNDIAVLTAGSEMAIVCSKEVLIVNLFSALKTYVSVIFYILF